MPFRKTISLIILCALFSSKTLFGATSPEASFVWASAGVATSTGLFESSKDRLSKGCKTGVISLAGAFTTLGLKNLAESHENFYVKNSLNTAAFFVYLCAQNRWNPFIKASWKGLLSKHSGKEISFFMLNSLAPAAIAWTIETQKPPASTKKLPAAKILAEKDSIFPPEATDSATPPIITPADPVTPPPTPRATNPEIYANFAQTPGSSPQAPKRAENLEIYKTPGREEDSARTSLGDLDVSRDEADFVADENIPEVPTLSPVAPTPAHVLVSPQSPPRISRKLFSTEAGKQKALGLQARIDFINAAAKISVAHNALAHDPTAQRAASANRQRPPITRDEPQRAASAKHQRPPAVAVPEDLPRSQSVPTPERAHAPEPIALTEQPKGPLKAPKGNNPKPPKPPAAKAANPVKPRGTAGFGASTAKRF